MIISIVHESPLGPLTLHSNGEALTGLEFEGHKHPLRSSPRGSDHVLDLARRELDAYFAGRLTRFATPVAGQGTPFQRRVWRALAAIPYGETRSYGAIAAAIGAPTSARAVGLANGRNPISIIVPCHRVIGVNGALTGYAGGTERKQRLLALERADIVSPRC